MKNKKIKIAIGTIVLLGIIALILTLYIYLSRKKVNEIKMLKNESITETLYDTNTSNPEETENHTIFIETETELETEPETEVYSFETIENEITETIAEYVTEATDISPVPIPTQVQTQIQVQTQAPAVEPATIAPTASVTIKFYGLEIKKGESGTVEFEVNNSMDDGDKITNHKKKVNAHVYYANTEKEAVEIYKEYMENIILSGNYGISNLLMIYVDTGISTFDALAKESENLKSLYIIEKYKQEIPKYSSMFGLDENTIKYNVDSISVTKNAPDDESYNTYSYSFWFNFSDSAANYKASLAKAQELANEAATKQTTYEKLRYVYDYFQNIEYVLESVFDSQGAYSAYFMGETVCAGIAKALSMSYEALGYETELILISHDRFNSHLALSVKIDENWYFIEGTSALKGNSKKNFLQGKDTLRPFIIEERNKETGMRNDKETKISDDYSSFYYFETPKNSATHEICDTTYDIEKFIESCKIYDYDIVKYDYSLLPVE